MQMGRDSMPETEYVGVVTAWRCGHCRGTGQIGYQQCGGCFGSGRGRMNITHEVHCTWCTKRGAAVESTDVYQGWDPPLTWPLVLLRTSRETLAFCNWDCLQSYAAREALQTGRESCQAG